MDKLTTALGYTPQKIAILRAIKLGDLLCAVPAFRALRAAFPDAHIALIGLPWADEFVISYRQYINEFIRFPGWPGLPEQPVDPVQTVAFLEEMQEREWDVVIQMQGNGTLVNAMLSLCGAKSLAGYYPEGIPSEAWAAGSGLLMPYPTVSHEVHRHVDLMTFLGLAPQGYELEFAPGYAASQQALDMLSEKQLIPGRYVCLHPGGISGRRWPTERFVEVANALSERGYPVVLTGSASEIPLVEAVRAKMTHPAFSFAGQTTLGTLGAILTFAALLVSNDTGVAHLATACHTPSVIIFTSADPAEWGPLDTERHQIVHENDAQGSQQVIHKAMALLSTINRVQPNPSPEG